jgi:hypothetical protein
MPEEKLNPEGKHSATREAAKDILLSILSMVVGVFSLYVMFYWVFYRGGVYIYHHTIQLVLHDEGRRKTVGEALKVLWTLTGAGIGAVIGTYVRQFFVMRALDDKIDLIAALRDDVLKTLDNPKPDVLAKIALDGDAVKYVLNEKDYGNLAKYLAAPTVLDLLRTVSAIQIIAAAIKEAEMGKTVPIVPSYAIKEAEVGKTVPIVPPYARAQLGKFDAAALHLELQPFQQVQHRFEHLSEGATEETF